MNRIKTVLVAAAVTCVMAVGSASASAAITTVPGTPTISFGTGALKVQFAGTGASATCGLTMNSTLGSSGDLTVTSATITPNPCLGSPFTFHTPWKGQIKGVPGNYVAQIPMSAKVVVWNNVPCEYSGVFNAPVKSGSTSVTGANGVLKGTFGGNPCPDLVLSGNGSISPAPTISGSL